MARKIRMTPFARFFIFLMIAAPLAFLGASYYRGEDGIAKIKSLLETLKGDRQDIELPNTATEPDVIPSKGTELEAKIDSVLQYQKMIIELLEDNQSVHALSEPDSL